MPKDQKLYPPGKNKSKFDLLYESIMLRQQQFLKENFDSFFISTFTYSPVSMSIMSYPEGVFLAVNGVFTALFGFAANEVIDKTTAQLPVYQDIADRESLYQQLKGKRKIYNLEQRMLTKSGEKKTLLISCSIYSRKGKKFVIVWGIDISEQKKVEWALRISEKRNQCFLNSIPDLMLIYDRDGYCQDFNAGKNAQKILAKEAFLNKNIKDILPPATADLVSAIIHKALSSNEVQIIEHGLDYQETHYTLEARISKLNDSQVFIMVRDITKLKSLQNELQRIDRLHLVGEIAAGVGHEIRNPLTTIRGFLQLLSAKPECQKYTSYFSLILEELDRTNAILGEFLSLSKKQSHDFSLQSLNKIISTLYPLLSADAILQNKQIDLDLEENLPDIPLNPGEIRQLVFNLVRNGLESMKSAGHLTIRTRRQDKQLILAIQDEGLGISEKQLENIGRSFSTTKEGGTGLGLAICYGIADHHKAVIDVETSSHGTTFSIRFPIAENE